MNHDIPLSLPRISVIIPALNETGNIDATLAALGQVPGVVEVIVVDGGSDDDTVARAGRHGITVLKGPAGRGAQMHAGALAAVGEVLWFLHADTLAPPQASAAIAATLVDPTIIAGNFEICFAGQFVAARFLTWLYGKLALIGLRYGDSGYFVRRSEYSAAGGFNPLPIFEDLDLMRRLRERGRFVRVAATVTTSSRRFEGRVFALVFAWWAVLQILYWVGIPPRLLGTLYRDVRSRQGQSPAGQVPRLRIHAAGPSLERRKAVLARSQDADRPSTGRIIASRAAGVGVESGRDTATQRGRRQEAAG